MKSVLITALWVAGCIIMPNALIPTAFVICFYWWAIKQDQ